MPTAVRPTTEALLNLIQTEWADIHHSRLQEWSALGVVTGAHLAVSQIPQFLEGAKVIASAPVAALVGWWVAIGFAVVGALVTCRHRRLMQIKLNWIYQAEVQLGLVKTAATPNGIIPEQARMQEHIGWRGLSCPRPLSTSGLILFFYGCLILFDLACLVLLAAA